MGNLLLEEIEYRIERTAWGTWRRYLYSNGRRFAEFKSHASLLGLPWLHYTYGICPETGRRIVAKGVVAVGRLAAGVVAIGHAAVGVIGIGQLGIGLLGGLGQAAIGAYALGQVALGAQAGVGQLATGRTAVGQMAYGTYVLAQLGEGKHVWSQARTDREAVLYFQALRRRMTGGSQAGD
ncbi:MAG TPA: hypothetical protein VKA50_00135 [Gammaproteobacteria bacterium]|nr:hypothetical protein [Gammaproteobacteria bacterium]